MKKMKFQTTLFTTLIAIIFSFTIFISSCNETGQSTANDEVTDETSEVDIIVEEDVWVIDEHQINDIPVTSKANTPKPKPKGKPKKSKTTTTTTTKNAVEENDEKVMKEAEAMEDEELEEEYAIATIDEMHLAMAEAEYDAMKNTYEVTEVAVPLEETQTVVAYGKKGQTQAALQVISSGDGEIEQIIFTDKKHQDVYDVQAGMSGKEVKKLRKELKHMVKKGQVFLYDDQSNVMYLMDAQNMVGDEITAADVESMDVQAIIWKDKKHHKKNE